MWEQRWVPSGQTVNQQYYTEFLTKLRERMRGNVRNYGETGQFCTRTTRQPTMHCLWSNFELIKTSLWLSTHSTRQTSLSATSASSQRLSQCSKEPIFVSVENVKAKTAETLNSLTEHDLRNCFEHWQHRTQLCVNSEGNYIEGDRSC